MSRQKKTDISVAPQKNNRQRRSRDQVRADAESAAKIYTERIRQGKPPLSLNGKTAAEKKIILAAEAEVMKEMEAAGQPFRRRREYHWHSEESRERTKKKPRLTTEAPAPEKSSEVIKTPRHQGRKSKVEPKLEVNESISRVFAEIEAREDELAKRTARLNVRERELDRTEDELKSERRKIGEDRERIIQSAESAASAIIKRAEDIEKRAKNLELVQTLGLSEADAQAFLKLGAPSPNREAVLKRLELYQKCYPNLDPWRGTASNQAFTLRPTKHIQGTCGFSVTWLPSQSNEPIAAPEAEVLLRIIATEVNSRYATESGIFELAFVTKSGRRKKLLHVLLPGGQESIMKYQAKPDAIVNHSLSRTFKELRDHYPEKTGWRGHMNGAYRSCQLAVSSGCFVFSFAGVYKDEVESSAVLSLFGAIIGTLSHFAAARGELERPITEARKPEIDAALRSVDENFENLSFPELQTWNSWLIQEKPGGWQLPKPVPYTNPKTYRFAPFST